MMETEEVISVSTGERKILIALPESRISKLLKDKVVEINLNGKVCILKEGILVASFNSTETEQPQQSVQTELYKPKGLRKQKVIEWLENPENQRKTKDLRLCRIFFKAT